MSTWRNHLQISDNKLNNLKRLIFLLYFFRLIGYRFYYGLIINSIDIKKYTRVTNLTIRVELLDLTSVRCTSVARTMLIDE